MLLLLVVSRIVSSRNRSRPSRSQRVPPGKPCPEDVYRVVPRRSVICEGKKPVFTHRQIRHQTFSASHSADNRGMKMSNAHVQHFRVRKTKYEMRHSVVENLYHNGERRVRQLD